MRRRTVPFRVVSQISFPQFGGFVSLGTGVLITMAGLVHVACPPGPQRALCRQTFAAQHRPGGIMVSFVPGPSGKAAINHYLAAYPSIAAQPLTPTSLVNFGEAVNFPLIFGAMLAVFGAATLAHLLVVSVSRRRREVGLLKVLGFVNGQVVSTVAWQATTLALVGIVIGVPLGLVVGRAVWRAFANNLGAVPVSVVPILLTAAIAVGRPRGRQPHRHRAGAGGDAIEGRGPPAAARLNAGSLPGVLERLGGNGELEGAPTRG